MKLKAMVKSALFKLNREWLLYRYRSAPPGSVPWLVGTEIKYGGIVSDVPTIRVSPKDPRTPERAYATLMTGGDRMLHHGYAQTYADYLHPFISESSPVTLAEVGILKGTGLAIWCDLFQSGRVLGLDIDLGHTLRNMPNLRARGAFRHRAPELHEFDQFVDNSALLDRLLQGDKIDIFVDDGYHSDETIVRTLQSALPHLAERFVYFIEDNSEVHLTLRRLYKDLSIDSGGQLTVVSRLVR